MGEKGVPGCAVVKSDLYIAPLIINLEQKKFKLDVYKSPISSNDPTFNLHSKQELNWPVGNHQIGESNNDAIAKIAKAAISSFSFKKTSNGLKISFAINARPQNANVGPHRSSGIVILELNDSFQITNIITKDLFQQNSFNDTNIKNELWNGYFSNEVIAKEGIDATLNNDYLTPFVGLGWAEVNNFASRTEDAWFVSLIQNPFDSNNSYELGPDINSQDYRIYRLNDNSYKNWGRWRWGQLGFDLLECGIPLLEYNENKTTPFDRNIFLTKNKESKAIMINQKDRGSSTANPATYSYHTSFENLTPSFNNFNRLLDQNMDNVTEQKIQDLINDANKDTFLRALNGKNIVSDATFAIRDIAFNFVSGTINFVLEMTKYFDERGIFQSGTKNI